MDVGPQRHQPSGHLAERFVDVNGVRRIYRVASGDNARTRLVVVLNGAVAPVSGWPASPGWLSVARLAGLLLRSPMTWAECGTTIGEVQQAQTVIRSWSDSISGRRRRKLL